MPVVLPVDSILVLCLSIQGPGLLRPAGTSDDAKNGSLGPLLEPLRPFRKIPVVCMQLLKGIDLFGAQLCPNAFLLNIWSSWALLDWHKLTP